jgi:hypothetical protein
VSARNPEALPGRNALIMMVDISSLRHVWATYSLQHTGYQGMPSRRCSSRTRPDGMQGDKLAQIDSIAWQVQVSPRRRTRSAPSVLSGSGQQCARPRTPSHPPNRNNRTPSTAVQGSGGQRVAAKSLSAVTSQIPAPRRRSRSRFPPALPGLLPNNSGYVARP